MPNIAYSRSCFIKNNHVTNLHETRRNVNNSNETHRGLMEMSVTGGTKG